CVGAAISPPALASARDRLSLPTARAGPGWCERGDSNPHALRHWNLNPGRLPIPPLSRRCILAPARHAGRPGGPAANACPETTTPGWAGRWSTLVGRLGFEPRTY